MKPRKPDRLNKASLAGDYLTLERVRKANNAGAGINSGPSPLTRRERRVQS